jgi:hypothetical protein
VRTSPREIGEQTWRRMLVEEALCHTHGTQLVLRDTGLSSAFYAHLGFHRVENAWGIEN